MSIAIEIDIICSQLDRIEIFIHVYLVCHDKCFLGFTLSGIYRYSTLLFSVFYDGCEMYARMVAFDRLSEIFR